MKRKLKKIICFFIIAGSCGISGNVNSYAEFFSDKVTYIERNDKERYAPFTSAFDGNLTFCREHGKHITGVGNIRYEMLDEVKPLKQGTAYLMEEIKKVNITRTRW